MKYKGVAETKRHNGTQLSVFQLIIHVIPVLFQSKFLFHSAVQGSRAQQTRFCSVCPFLHKQRRLLFLWACAVGMSAQSLGACRQEEQRGTRGRSVRGRVGIQCTAFLF